MCGLWVWTESSVFADGGIGAGVAVSVAVVGAFTGTGATVTGSSLGSLEPQAVNSTAAMAIRIKFKIVTPSA